MNKNIVVSFMYIFAAAWCFGETDFARGKDLFMHNKPHEAVDHLVNHTTADPSHVTAFLYLGIAYEQMDHIDEAIEVYSRILDQAGDLTAAVANNLGNAYFKKGSISEAEMMYGKALDADRLFASAYLGRANARMKRGSPQEAVPDYEQYLRLEPRAPQKHSIERLINYIKTESAEVERRRLVAEEVARLEEERHRRLLDEISASLQTAGGASRGLSSGAEDIEGYEEEFELE